MVYLAIRWRSTTRSVSLELRINSGSGNSAMKFIQMLMVVISFLIFALKVRRSHQFSELLPERLCEHAEMLFPFVVLETMGAKHFFAIAFPPSDIVMVFAVAGVNWALYLVKGVVKGSPIVNIGIKLLRITTLYLFLCIISGNTTNKSDCPESSPLIKKDQSESTLFELANQSEKRELDSDQLDAFLNPPTQPKRRKSESSKSDDGLKGSNQSKRRNSDTNQPDDSVRSINQSKRSKSDILNFGKKSEPEWWAMSPGIQSQRMKSDDAGVVDRKPDREWKSSSPLDVLIALVSTPMSVYTCVHWSYLASRGPHCYVTDISSF